MFQLECPDIREVMTELVETLRHKLEGRGFDYRCGKWDFVSLIASGYTIVLGVESVCNENECQHFVLVGKVGRCLKLSSMPPSYAGSLEILRASNPWSPYRLRKPVWFCFVSVVNAKLHDSESLITEVCGYAVGLATSQEFLPYFCIDKRRVMCPTVLVLPQIVTFIRV